MAAMAHNRGEKIGQNVEALEITAFGDRQQTSRGQLALSATVAEADFAPLHARAQRSFSAVVGGLNALPIEESEQPLIVHQTEPWRGFGPHGGYCPNAARPTR